VASRYALTASGVTQKGGSQFRDAEKIYNNVFEVIEEVSNENDEA